jgi:hypothetical protein
MNVLLPPGIEQLLNPLDQVRIAEDHLLDFFQGILDFS